MGGREVEREGGRGREGEGGRERKRERERERERGKETARQTETVTKKQTQRETETMTETETEFMLTNLLTRCPSTPRAVSAAWWQGACFHLRESGNRSLLCQVQSYQSLYS